MPAPRAKWTDEPTQSGDELLAKGRANRWAYACIVLAIALAVSLFSYWLQIIHVNQQDQTIQNLTAEVQALKATQ